MSYRSRAAASLIFSAAFLFSSNNGHGQALATNDPSHLVTLRASPNRSKDGAQNKLPFEQSVVIYYGAQSKPAAPRLRPIPAANETRSTTAMILPKANSNTLVSAAKQDVSRSNFIFDLQPIVISYRISKPTLFVNFPTTAATEPVSALVLPVARGGAAVQQKETNEPATVAEKTLETPAPKTEPAAPNTVAVEKANVASKEGSDIQTAATNTTSVTPMEAVAEPIANKVESPESKENKPADIAATGEAAPASAAKPNGLVEMNNMAVQLTLDSNYSEAEGLLESAIKQDPTVAKFHRNLSIVLEKMNRFDEALASARTAANLDPSNPAILDQLCLLELAKGSAPAAVECYTKLDSVQPLDADTEAFYGMALFRVGKMDESQAILEKAAKSTPPAASVLNALGVVYFTKKRYEEAVIEFKNAVEADPDLSDLRFNLAIAQLACKNKPAALSQYNILKKDNAKLADQLYRALFSDKIVDVRDLKSVRH